MNIILLIIGIIAGFFIGYLYKKSTTKLIPTEENKTESFKIDIATLTAKLADAKNHYKEEQEKVKILSNQKDLLLSGKRSNKNIQPKFNT